MSYNHKDYKNMQVAKNRLKKTVEMVRASKEYKNGSYRADAVSMLAQSMLPHLKKNSLKALHIYEAVLGGWHADLELRGMPTGINRMLGTPVASPCDTREEAENFGYHLVATVLSMIESGSLSALDEKAIDGSLAFFEFYGVSFGLEIDFLNQLADRKTGGLKMSTELLLKLV